ncbi:NPC intracellular cholesterol transporter 2-like [Bradysia coprophila]|uniref:NPC intracellular cholesterol transporter 2-like n=1 Tax=Bradysia coprophila TaxID=38358 RepID=UPI00187DA32C|nr:NPC intracellular cholesterol transporter 2-like [Bradysia coprophila]
MLNIKSLAQTFVLLLSIGFSCAQISPLPGWSSCATGPNPATGVSIGVTNCTTAPCTFFLGQSYTFTVYARSGVNTNSVPYAVTAAFPGLGSYKFIEGDGCDVLLLGTCPINNGNLYLADLTYDVLSNTPTGYSVIEISVKDASNSVIICAQFFAIIAA